MQQELRYIKIQGNSEAHLRIVFLGAGQEAKHLLHLFRSIPPYSTYFLEIQDLVPATLVTALRQLCQGHSIDIIGLSMGTRAALWAAMHLRPKQLVLIAPEGTPPHPWLQAAVHPRLAFLWSIWHRMLPFIRKRRKLFFRILGSGVPYTPKDLMLLRTHWTIAARYTPPPDVLERLAPIPVKIYLSLKDKLISFNKVAQFWQPYIQKEFFFINTPHFKTIKESSLRLFIKNKKEKITCFKPYTPSCI